jgi:hypothetical protein
VCLVRICGCHGALSDLGSTGQGRDKAYTGLTARGVVVKRGVAIKSPIEPGAGSKSSILGVV